MTKEIIFRHTKKCLKMREERHTSSGSIAGKTRLSILSLSLSTCEPKTTSFRQLHYTRQVRSECDKDLRHCRFVSRRRQGFRCPMRRWPRLQRLRLPNYETTKSLRTLQTLSSIERWGSDRVRVDFCFDSWITCCRRPEKGRRLSVTDGGVNERRLKTRRRWNWHSHFSLCCCEVA